MIIVYYVPDSSPLDWRLRRNWLTVMMYINLIDKLVWFCQLTNTPLREIILELANEQMSNIISTHRQQYHYKHNSSELQLYCPFLVLVIQLYHYKEIV